MNERNIQDGFKELLHTQQCNEMPDYLEASIMAKIQPAKAGVQLGLASVFILSCIASVYLLLSIFSFYYYPGLVVLQDIKAMLLLTFFVKLVYDLNEILPGMLQQFSFFKRSGQH